MSWSDALAASAQRVVDWNADMCAQGMQHSASSMNNGAGENLYQNSSSAAGWAEAMLSLYDVEIGMYNWAQPPATWTASPQTGAWALGPASRAVLAHLLALFAPL
jgi:hypothetical protein